MSRGQVSEVRGQSLRRVAIILAAYTMADCPIEAVCVSMVTDPKRKVKCGYYLGSMTNCNGSVVKCGYQEK
ncbi:MAG: hypothetical protein ACD_75C00843G0008 [uncultured bacterium]|nr:MAG: hypothetical protein ACD_75C00843G0008 [uncultured bacterium]